jgi:hypothetical protein
LSSTDYALGEWDRLSREEREAHRRYDAAAKAYMANPSAALRAEMREARQAWDDRVRVLRAYASDLRGA